MFLNNPSKNLFSIEVQNRKTSIPTFIRGGSIFPLQNKIRRSSTIVKDDPIELIIALDTSIGSFVSSKIFGNVNVIDPAVAVKTRTDLVNILDLSDKLSKEAKKMK